MGRAFGRRVPVGPAMAARRCGGRRSTALHLPLAMFMWRRFVQVVLVDVHVSVQERVSWSWAVHVVLMNRHTGAPQVNRSMAVMDQIEEEKRAKVAAAAAAAAQPALQLMDLPADALGLVLWACRGNHESLAALACTCSRWRAMVMRDVALWEAMCRCAGGRRASPAHGCRAVCACRRRVGCNPRAVDGPPCTRPHSATGAGKCMELQRGVTHAGCHRVVDAVGKGGGGRGGGESPCPTSVRVGD